MGHNHARPAGPAQRLERVLSRLPDEWEVRVERGAGETGWRALIRNPGKESVWSEPEATLVDALECAWRLNR